MREMRKWMYIGKDRQGEKNHKDEKDESAANSADPGVSTAMGLQSDRPAMARRPVGSVGSCSQNVSGVDTVGREPSLSRSS